MTTTATKTTIQSTLKAVLVFNEKVAFPTSEMTRSFHQELEHAIRTNTVEDMKFSEPAKANARVIIEAREELWEAYVQALIAGISSTYTDVLISTYHAFDQPASLARVIIAD